MWFVVIGSMVVALWALGKAQAAEDALDRAWIRMGARMQEQDERISSLEGRLAGLGAKITLPSGSQVKEQFTGHAHPLLD